MAEGEEQKKSGEEGEEKKSTHPPGFRFMPTDEELVEYYLLPRLQGRPHVPNDCIIEDNVYRCHPDELIDGTHISCSTTIVLSMPPWLALCYMYIL